MTNYERIKNMSVEEMADETYRQIEDCRKCPVWEKCDRITHKTGFFACMSELDCAKMITDWLNEEAEE